MFNKLRRYFVTRKLKKFISRATNIIYSEQSDLINYLERDLVAGKKPFDLLCTYIAIRIAADAKTPIEKSHIENALQELYSPKLAYKDYDEYETVVGFLKAQADQSLLIAEIEFVIGKTAYEANEYSYEGIMYRIAKAKKGPLSLEERKQYATLSAELMETERQLEEHLAKTTECN